ncbi:MAG: HNH endonuclease [Methylovirgula sp.]
MDGSSAANERPEKTDSDFFVARRCMREPTGEIFYASRLLDRATDAHLEGNHSEAEQLIRTANMPAVRAWTESLWGSKAANPDQWRYHRFREIAAAPPHLPKTQRIPQRMPPSAEKTAVIERYGRNCAFCGIPLIRKEVRMALRHAYPDALPWGRANQNQHAAFQCMWMQFDHILPHSRGGGNTLDNVVVTCAPCNYGRWHWTLEEVGLMDPRTLPIHKTSWDGLERLLLIRN